MSAAPTAAILELNDTSEAMARESVSAGTHPPEVAALVEEAASRGSVPLSELELLVEKLGLGE